MEKQVWEKAVKFNQSRTLNREPKDCQYWRGRKKPDKILHEFCSWKFETVGNCRSLGKPL